ncbi:hypothetical protein C8J57DRAFT_1541623 [Mycena rebaudengoi]|nr:hypothetical protein C8J57DRAFT_1541623 [Mycena rebaudengoi]
MLPDWGLSSGSGLGWILIAHPLFSVSSSSSAAELVHSSQNHPPHSLRPSVAHPPCAPSAVWAFRDVLSIALLQIVAFRKTWNTNYRYIPPPQRSLIDRILSTAGTALALDWPYCLLLVARFVAVNRESAIAAPTPAHDAGIQPLSTRLSATILHVIRAPPAASLRVVLPRATTHATGILHPRVHLPLTHRLHQADSRTFGVRTGAREWPPVPAFLFELPPTDSMNAEVRLQLGHIISARALDAPCAGPDGGRRCRFSLWLNSRKYSAAGHPGTFRVAPNNVRVRQIPSDIVCGLATQRTHPVYTRLAVAHHLRDIRSMLRNVGDGVAQDIVYAVAKSRAGIPSTRPLVTVPIRHARLSEGDCAAWSSILVSAAAAWLPLALIAYIPSTTRFRRILRQHDIRMRCADGSEGGALA